MIVLISDQRLIQRWWVDYAGDEEPTNTLLREFYVSVIRPSDLYYYGIVFEVFDLLTNEPYEWRDHQSQRQEQESVQHTQSKAAVNDANHEAAA